MKMQMHQSCRHPLPQQDPQQGRLLTSPLGHTSTTMLDGRSSLNERSCGCAATGARLLYWSPNQYLGPRLTRWTKRLLLLLPRRWWCHWWPLGKASEKRRARGLGRRQQLSGSGAAAVVGGADGGCWWATQQLLLLDCEAATAQQLQWHLLLLNLVLVHFLLVVGWVAGLGLWHCGGAVAGLVPSDCCTMKKRYLLLLARFRLRRRHTAGLGFG
jgi:hypothetical protein